MTHNLKYRKSVFVCVYVCVIINLHKTQAIKLKDKQKN